jgi:hypothetical protein
MDCTQQSTAKDTCDTHHVEGVQGPVMETLKEKQEAEDCGDAERRGKEPTRLTQRIDKKDRDEDGDGARERDCVIGPNTYEAGNLKLSEHETD